MRNERAERSSNKRKCAKGGTGSATTRAVAVLAVRPTAQCLVGGSKIVPDDQTTVLGATGGTGADGTPGGLVGLKLVVP